jgi:two-component system sensor histidine kinase AlgZ
MIFFLGRSRADARDAARAAELALKVAENQRLQAQLSALTAKLNPHLLFNALNTVAGLIPTQPAVAEQTVVRLAELYRGVLESMRRDTHSLAAELHLCEAYLDVEKARFGERLQSTVDEGNEKIGSLEVPVMILQPLIENAVRHGLSSRASGGRVDVRARVIGAQLELSVEDDGVGLGSSSHVGSGTGVAMCRERLRLRYGEGASLDLGARKSGGTRVALRLPLPSLGASAGANGG